MLEIVEHGLCMCVTEQVSTATVVTSGKSIVMVFAKYDNSAAKETAECTQLSLLMRGES